ncbi:albumin-like [Dendrobates tinctorius]|uniref:albumin-like n=1 Tax=Dendrobates tinctorius TaxID=92724 RepID=UPI003CCA4EF1
MKWVTLICVLLCTIATESRHLQKRDTDHHPRNIGGVYVTLGQDNFKHILLVKTAQNFQKCTLEQHWKLVQELSAIAEHCVDHKDEADCKKRMNTIFYDKVCTGSDENKSYPWKADCCGKQDPEREKCFHDHRDTNIEPFKKPDAGAACKLQTENPHEAYHYFIDTIAKRHPSLFPPAILELGKQYSMIMHDCCAEEEKEKCFDARFVDVEKATLLLDYEHKHVCRIVKSFPLERVYYAKNLAIFAKKFRASSFDVVHKLILESVPLIKDCCNEHVVECMTQMMEYIQHVCDNHEKLSPNLKACCEKSIRERTPCMMTLPNEEVLADLPKEMKEFVEAEDVCKHYAEEKDLYLAKFLFEFTRRNPELSDLSCVRVAKDYEALLTKCCAEEHPANCYKAAPQLFEARIKEIQALAKQNCDAYEHHGPHAYNAELLGRYVPKMPQVSDETLLRITGEMTKFAGKCCALPENHTLSCADGKLDMLLGDMCERESQTFINDQVHHCCVDSYADRRPCFTKLGRDPSYKAPEFDVNHYKGGADVCEGTEEEQKQKQLGMLIRVLKDKPDTPPEKRMQIIGKFNEIREKCCAEENHQSCFDSERPAFLLHLKDLLSH